MNNEGKILDLVLNGAGKTAADLTHELRTIGNGDMAEGIAQIANFAAESGFKVGYTAGVKVGVCGSLVLASAGFLLFYKWHIGKIEKSAAMRQHFEDNHRTAQNEHWNEYEELKATAAQEPFDEEAEKVVS